MFVVTSVVLILFVMLMAVLRLALPYLTSYQDEVENKLQDALGYPVQLARIDADWYWLSPRIKLIDVKINKRGQRSQLVRFDEVIVEFGIVSNLLNLSFEPTVISLNGSHLNLLRDKSGQLSVQGLPLDMLSAGVGHDAAVTAAADKALEFLNNKTIELQDLTVRWTDLSVSSVSMNFNVRNLAFKVNDGQYGVYIDTETPEQIGKKILLIARMKKNKENWQSSVYINADAVQLDYFMHYIKTPGFKVSSKLDAELWLKLNEKELTSLKGIVASSDLVLSSAHEKNNKSWSASKLSVNFQLAHTQNEWQLVFDDINMKLAEHDWNHLYLSLTYNEISNALAMRSEYLDLADAHYLLTKLPLNDDLAKNITLLKPEGILRKTEVVINDWKRPGDWLLKTRFEEFGISLPKRNIRLDGLSGELQLDKDKGQLMLDSQQAVFKSDLFNEALAFEAVKGVFDVERDAEKFKINSDLLSAKLSSVDVFSRLNIEFNDQLYADFQIQIDKADSTMFKRHRSDGLLGKKVAGWLTESIVQGELTDLKFLFHGAVNEFPFAANQGVMQSAFNIDKGILNYNSDWPKINNIKAKFSADNSKLQIAAESASTAEAELTDVLTTIDLAGDKHVKVSGTIAAVQENVDAFFTATPLKRNYRLLTQYTKLAGELSCRLNLDIPLDAKSQINVSGQLDLNNNELDIEKFGYHFDAVNAAVIFNNASIEAEPITAVFNQQSLEASVNTVIRGSGDKTWKQTLLSAKVKSDIKSVLPFDINTDSLFNNQTDWQLAMAFNHPPSDLEVMSLSLESKLSNIDIQLPRPFAKAAEETAPFYLGAKFSSEYSDLKISYNDLLDMTMQWDNESDAVRSAIKVNSGVAELPEKGIYLAANVEQLDLKQWQEIVLPFFTGPSNNFELDQLQLQINADKLFYQRYQLSKIKMNAALLDGNWNINLDSDKAAANVRFSEGISDENPISVSFSKMDLSPVDAEEDLPATSTDKTFLNTISPSKIPALNVSGKNFRYKNYQFDAIEIQSRQSSYGLALHSMNLTADAVNIKAKGNWLVGDNGKVQSSLRLELESDDVGKVLSSFDITKSIKDGKGSAVIDWQWPASPFDFDWKYVSGRMDLEVKDGRFVDIEPGAGRLLGVFSLSALPRRFILDFSDTFSEGYEFNRLKSHSSFEKGQLSTTNTYITGTSADVYFKGRIGLSDKDYDQVMSVVPRITSGVSGWLAVLQGATVGLVAYVGQKLLGVDEAAKNQYHITGSWSNPLITKIDSRATPSSLNSQPDE